MSRPASAPAGTTRSDDRRLGTASWITARETLRARWTALAARERAGLSAAAWLVGVLLLWSVAIQPAWRTLREAPARIDQQGTQLQRLNRLAAEATELRAIAPVPSAQANAALQGTMTRFAGRASLQWQGELATVAVNGLSGDELRDWLAEVRSASRMRATQLQLTRGAQGYSGTLVLSPGGQR
ncbi:MAG: general secretion pathway protein GspM [Burkholderiales bacterium PBB1]|nr:MAG: general secretion pathway protein GspM [Burkholderiales bacterium PBB1]